MSKTNIDNEIDIYEQVECLEDALSLARLRAQPQSERGFYDQQKEGKWVSSRERIEKMGKVIIGDDLMSAILIKETNEVWYSKHWGWGVTENGEDIVRSEDLRDYKAKDHRLLERARQGESAAVKAAAMVLMMFMGEGGKNKFRLEGYTEVIQDNSYSYRYEFDIRNGCITTRALNGAELFWTDVKDRVVHSSGTEAQQAIANLADRYDRVISERFIQHDREIFKKAKEKGGVSDVNSAKALAAAIALLETRPDVRLRGYYEYLDLKVGADNCCINRDINNGDVSVIWNNCLAINSQGVLNDLVGSSKESKKAVEYFSKAYDLLKGTMQKKEARCDEGR